MLINDINLSGSDHRSAAEATADRIHSAAIRILRLVRREDERIGLTAPRLSALSAIVFAERITLTELAAAEQVRPPTMTRIVDALVAAGLAARSPDPDDRRVSHIAATGKGKALLASGRARRVRALAGRIERLSADERGALAEAAALMERLTEGG